MNNSIQKGFGFGLTSGIITTLGLIMGLATGTNSRLAVIGGILTIAVADAFSDALGMHISEESIQKRSTKKNQKSVWEATLSTFGAKFIFALTFLAPVLMLDLSRALVASAIWGILLIALFSYTVAKHEKENPWKVIGEHMLITFAVIFATYYLGTGIASVFG
jgi:VIT1/CCC1 family predicted Fe2+/Mn2+ transporter